MTAEDLLATLAEHHIELYLDDGQLGYRAPSRALTSDLRREIGAHRAEIVQRLETRNRGGARERCRPTCDSDGWRDDPPQQGRIRTTCGQCGRFIGYRPASQ